MKLIRFLLPVYLLLILSGCAQKKPANLIENPGFETGSGKEPPGWVIAVSSNIGSYQLGTTNDNPHSGDSAYRIARVFGEAYQRAGVQTSNPIPIKTDKKYILSFWYRTSKIHEYREPFSIRFNMNRKNQKPLRYEKWLPTNPEWRQLYWLLDKIPNNGLDVKISVSIFIPTKGELLVDDFVFKEAAKSDIESFEQWRRQPIPEPVGVADKVSFKGTGFFRVEKDNQRWWLIEPKGKATWAIGTMATAPVTTRDGTSALIEWIKKNYPEKMSYCWMLFGLLEKWGFNSFAGWTADEFAEITAERYKENKPYFPMYRVLGLSRMGEKNYYARNRNGDIRGGGHAFPDPFNPQWRKDARKKAAETIPKFKDKPWFAAWFVDNENGYRDLYKYIWAEYSSKEFIKYLRKKYKTIQNLNSKWTSSFGKYSYNSFNDIIKEKPEPKDWDDPLYTDFTTFERIMIKEYVDFTYDLIKKLDPNHLIISNRHNLGQTPSLYRHIDLWGKYDIVCLNIYPQNLLFGFNQGEIAMMKDLHKATGKPVIIGEWSVPAIDSKLYDFGEDPHGRQLDWSWPQVLRTQKERGEAYKACMFQLASLDFIIGADWFKPLDVDSPTRRSNRGIINNKHEIYTDLANAMKETNEYIKNVMKLPW